MSSMTTVAIVARPDLREAAQALRDLVAWLRERKVGVVVEARTAALMDGDGIAGKAGWEGVAAADVVVVLGGDGTLLAASQLLERPSVPVLGVNFGSLGFLTEIALPELYAALSRVLSGSYEFEERGMLRAVLRRPSEADLTVDVLNDVVVTKASLSRIIELDVSVDGLFVSAFRADGLIISTPTGSTAYNLAAGGPILHPALPAVVLTPICPHMLTNRPLVLSAQSVIEVRLRASRDDEAHTTFDGQRGFALSADDTLTVTSSPRTLRLVKVPDRDYFKVLRTKLKWGETTARRPGS